MKLNKNIFLKSMQMSSLKSNRKLLRKELQRLQKKIEILDRLQLLKQNLYNQYSYTSLQVLEYQHFFQLSITQAKRQQSSSEYSPQPQHVIQKRERLEASRKYLKKNTESNISNQIFSYVSNRYKSEYALLKTLRYLKLDIENTLTAYYEYMKIIKKQKTKYLNKKYLQSVSEINQAHQSFPEISCLGKLQVLPIKIFGKLIKILTKFFINNVCHVSIITSKKMDKQTRLEHLERRRKIRGYLKQRSKKITLKERSA